MHKFGWHFLVTKDWAPVNEQYGALPFIFGTLVSSAIALIIAVPISIATAVDLTELATLAASTAHHVHRVLAAVPRGRDNQGLWGIFVMVPFLRNDIFPVLQKFLRLFHFSKVQVYVLACWPGGSLWRS